MGADGLFAVVVVEKSEERILLSNGLRVNLNGSDINVQVVACGVGVYCGEVRSRSLVLRDDFSSCEVVSIIVTLNGFGLERDSRSLHEFRHKLTYVPVGRCDHRWRRLRGRPLYEIGHKRAYVLVA